jgi:hypothetical protein
MPPAALAPGWLQDWAPAWWGTRVARHPVAMPLQPHLSYEVGVRYWQAPLIE